MRPSSSRCQYVVGTVYGSDRLSVSAPAVVSPAVPRAVPPAVLPATRSTLLATTPNSTRPGTIIDMTALTIPETALVVLVGAGAAAFASRHFPHGQLLVSDAGIAERLRAGELTLVDATDLEPPARARLAALARDHDVPAVAIVLEPPTHLPGFGTGYEPDGDVSAMVVYGHTPVPRPEWVNNTICLDTGCVFGGSLTALRYPERELVSVPAARTYYAPARPLGA